MNSLTIVVEGRSDAILLRRLLGQPSSLPLRFYAGQGRESLATLGRNILVHEGAPVLVVMDTDTLNPLKAREACELIEVSLRRFSAEDQSAVFGFLPELEVVFFEAPAVLERRFGPEAPGPAMIDRGRLQPKATLQGILKAASLEHQAYFKGLSGEDIEELRRGEQASRLVGLVEELAVGVGR